MFPRELQSPCPPYDVAGMAILICLYVSVSVLAACSGPSPSPSDIAAPGAATPHSATATTSTRTPTTPVTVTQTPIPTILPSASTVILRLAVAPARTSVSYDRSEWKHWIDEDDDCQNTRQEALLAESAIAVEFRDSRRCEVATGRWTDPYTGSASTNPGDLDIDHMVPLANAHRSGGYAWDEERKSKYANHLAYDAHLIAVTASANRSKGSKGPDEWKPPNRGYWCQYALDWITIKREWELTATEDEADALSEMLDTCETRIYIQVTRLEETPSSETPTPAAHTPEPTAFPTPAHTPIPAPTPTPAPIPVQDRNCSDFDSWAEAQAFFESAGGPDSDQHKLDRDGDGVACQSLPGSPGIAPPVVTPTQAPAPPTLGPVQDRNCSDFDTWLEAQEFFKSAGGPDSDPHRLDRDGDGIACQSLPGAPTSAATPMPTDIQTAILEFDCSDFNTWSEAQAFFVSYSGSDSHLYRLDMDGNGIPCQSLIGAPAPLTPTLTPLQDLDCSDFDSWSEAQDFFEEQDAPDSDPHNLDRDGDGIACQSLPGAPNSAPIPIEDRNCSDFDSWSEAQDFFEEQDAPDSDPHNLDRDGDGIACQSLPGAPNSAPIPIEDRNCSDFHSWSEAQDFFESEGGPESDPHRLDRDGDGIACQSLRSVSGPSTPASTDTSGAESRDSHNCSDFDTWSEAQAFFESEGGPESDPHRLDRDGDGAACQSLPGSPNSAPTPAPDHAPTPTPASKPRDTHNCSDFDTWSEAQAFFESEGGPDSDPHRLDRDGDGVACQSLPGSPGSESTSKSVAKPAATPTPKLKDTHNCSDFDTWSEAQAFFESEGGPGSDPHRLDRDGDGIACQSLPGSPSSAPESTPIPTPTSVPTTRTPTETPTPESEDTHNCSDFDTWSEAQSFFESEGGPGSDPHRLDRDKDGIACQSLKGAPKTPTPVSADTPTPTAKAKDTHNCSDFDTWSEAQSFFESEGGPGSDPHNLDGDDDGIACQSLKGAPKTPTPTPDQ